MHLSRRNRVEIALPARSRLREHPRPNPSARHPVRRRRGDGHQQAGGHGRPSVVSQQFRDAAEWRPCGGCETEKTCAPAWSAVSTRTRRALSWSLSHRVCTRAIQRDARAGRVDKQYLAIVRGRRNQWKAHYPAAAPRSFGPSQGRRRSRRCAKRNEVLVDSQRATDTRS
jgi:hypothetical protein